MMTERYIPHEIRESFKANTLDNADTIGTTKEHRTRYEALGYTIKDSKEPARWEVKEQLGSIGAFGSVYEGYDRKLERPVAIKFFRRMDYLPNWVGRAESEALTIAKISHPCVPKVYEFGIEKSPEGEEMPFIISEIFPPSDYRRLLDAVTVDKPEDILSPLEVVEYFSQLGDAIDFLASLDIFHFDIHPGNIMLPKDITVGGGYAKLIDFGIANIKSIRIGDFYAPEIGTDADSNDIRSDLYSLGVVLTTVIFGNPLLDGLADSIDELGDNAYKEARSLNKRLLKKYAKAHELNLDADKILRFLDKACAYNPNDRFQSGAEFSQGLQDAFTEKQPWWHKLK
jgi:serine/threonine protein kinase